MSEPPRSITRTYAGYLGIRLLLFGAALAICIALGMNGLLAVVVALLASGVIAFPLARRQRDEIARALQQRRGGR
jgi:multisubunit Na+/H+ antiporter MnhG subunit